MTEEDARKWIRTRFDVSRETLLARFVDLVLIEARIQNLISENTIDSIWARHIVDSGQLVSLADEHRENPGTWTDIGSGAGFPGMVAAILRGAPTVLIEPRKRRADFLQHCADILGIRDRVTVAQRKVERHRAKQPAAIISARAVAALPTLLATARHIADRNTLWLLPKGASAHSEVEAARKAWQGSFHVEPSITHPDSLIVIAREVRAR